MNKQKIRKVFDKLFDEIFVDKYNCIVCDAELQGQSKYGLCPECKSNLTFLGERICKKCGRLQYDEADYCLTCQSHKRHFDFARSCVVYDNMAKEIVRGIKFGGKKYFAKYMARFLVERYEDVFKDIPIDVVIPIPLLKKRRKIRGYNQSWEIARRFADALDLVARDDVVVKVKDTAEQAKLSGKDRENNLIGAFNLKDKGAVENKMVLLIDDVMTTGSTASEVARELRKANVKGVYALTFASTKYKIEEQKR